MAIKEFLYRFRPAQLYIVLVLSICYFGLQMVLSHLTHALTLLMASYHMLCNIFALTGCILTIKHSKKSHTEENIDCSSPRKYNRNTNNEYDQFTCINLSVEEQSLRNIECRERKLRNTFGWTRIDVLTMLIVCIILASLSFSLLVEALQTLVHIDHQDSMHLPILVMVLGFVGLILNGICYLLIGGYTMHQSSFLHVTPSGDVVLDNGISTAPEMSVRVVRNVSSSTVVDNQELDNSIPWQKKQSLVEMFRDVSSTIFAIVCAFIVYISNDEHTSKFVDPVLSIFSCVVLVTLSYPYMKESCLILLQTIPGSIDIDIFEQTLGSKFPEIISYHDLHIWQLTSNKYVSTVHIKFKSQRLYVNIIEDVRRFFFNQGITIVTIQPEFEDIRSTDSLECLVQCSANDCAEKVCCQQSRTDLRETSVPPFDDGLHPTEKTSVKMQEQEIPSITDLRITRRQSLEGGLHPIENTLEKMQELKSSSLFKLNTMIERSQSDNNLANSYKYSQEKQQNSILKSACEMKLRENENKISTLALTSSPDVNSAEEIKTV